MGMKSQRSLFFSLRLCAFARSLFSASRRLRGSILVNNSACEEPRGRRHYSGGAAGTETFGASAGKAGSAQYHRPIFCGKNRKQSPINIHPDQTAARRAWILWLRISFVFRISDFPNKGGRNAWTC
jgi:hypothetical protein